MWKRYKEGEKQYLSVVYESYGGSYGGYYIDFPEDGDLYIRICDLGKPAEGRSPGLWKSIKEKPTEPGIYVVARFEGDEMVEYDTNWACVEGYFGPNNQGWQVNIHPTHWMTAAEYRSFLATAPKEAF